MNQQPNKRGIRKGFAEISTNLLFNSKIFLTGKGGGDGSKSIQIAIYRFAQNLEVICIFKKTNQQLQALSTFVREAFF